MKSMKKILAVLLAVMLMVPSMAVFAAPSPAKVDMKDANVTIKNFEYNGTMTTPLNTITYNGQTLVKDKDFAIAGLTHKNVGTYTVTIVGMGNFEGTIKVTYEIKKAKNVVPMDQDKTVTATGKKLTANKTVATTKGNGAITSWKVIGLKNPKNAKYVSVDKTTGKVTIKKGAPKGGVFKVQISFAGDDNHYARTTTVRVVVK